MATQKTDGLWTETEPIETALNTFQGMLNEGTAKRFVVGTEQEIEEEKARIGLEEELEELKQRMDHLEQRADPAPIVAPTCQEIEEFGEQSS